MNSLETSVHTRYIHYCIIGFHTFWKLTTVNLSKLYHAITVEYWIMRQRSIGAISLRWRHNGHDGVSNHQPHHCLLNHLFGCRSKKTSKLCVTGLCPGNSPGPVNSPYKWPVTRKMFPFDDVIMMASYNVVNIVCLTAPSHYLKHCCLIINEVTLACGQFDRKCSRYLSLIKFENN